MGNGATNLDLPLTTLSAREKLSWLLHMLLSSVAVGKTDCLVISLESSFLIVVGHDRLEGCKDGVLGRNLTFTEIEDARTQHKTNAWRETCENTAERPKVMGYLREESREENVRVVFKVGTGSGAVLT
jgi:hypothetical protein